MNTPTPMREFPFDLRGFCILPDALDAGHFTAIGEWVDHPAWIGLGAPRRPPAEGDDGALP